MYYLFIDLLVCLHWKNRRFTAFLDSKIHTRLAIVTGNELGLAFPLGTFPKNFGKAKAFAGIINHYLSIGNGQNGEPALCQLYRHTFVRC